MSNKQASIKDIRKLNIKELSKKLHESYARLVKANKEVKTKQTKNTNAAAFDKKTIAHIKTVIGEKILLAKLDKKVTK